MAKRDFYEVLGVSRNANEAEIKSAYRKLAMKHHPDRNSGDKKAEETFKSISEAYEVLSNAQKRTAYDQFGHAGVDPSATAQGGFGGGSASHFGDIFGDVFGDIFGGGSGQRSTRGFAEQGSDLRYNLDLSLAEAAHGKTVEIRIPTWIGCKTCHGNGTKSGAKPKSCTSCGGVGQVRMQQGFFSIQQPCPTCRGRGSVVSDPCQPCRGQGRVQDYKTLSVRVPTGIDNGDRIRLTGEGEAGIHGGPPGDLYVQIQLRKHAIFTRDGTDLHCEVPISFTKAALGGEIDVPTLQGRVKLKIPPETQTDRVLRVKGKGVSTIRSKTIGDLLCRIVVEVPVNLSKRQKELLTEFEATMQEESARHTPRVSSWFQRVKQFFEEIKPS
jgi:molecular chaperone DnaJ